MGEAAAEEGPRAFLHFRVSVSSELSREDADYDENDKRRDEEHPGFAPGRGTGCLLGGFRHDAVLRDCSVSFELGPGRPNRYFLPTVYTRAPGTSANAMPHRSCGAIGAATSIRRARYVRRHRCKPLSRLGFSINSRALMTNARRCMLALTTLAHSPRARLPEGLCNYVTVVGGFGTSRSDRGSLRNASHGRDGWPAQTRSTMVMRVASR